MLTDFTGDTLDVSNNQTSRNDILSIVDLDYRERLQFSESGRVSLNLDGLDKEELKSIDKGLYLLNLLIEAEEKYLYSAGDLVRMGKGDEVLTIDVHGVKNASVFGKDSKGGYDEVPLEGYQGHVAIAESGQFLVTEKGIRDVRASTVFHELAENYYRTTMKMDYRPKSRGGNDRHGAHGRAILLELIGAGFGNPSPGSAKYVNSDPWAFTRK